VTPSSPDLQVVKRNLRPCSLFTPDPGHDRHYCTKFGAWCVRKLTPVDHELLRRSKGRFTIFGPIGAPLLLLHHDRQEVGSAAADTTDLHARRRSTVPAGSNFGQAAHPRMVVEPAGRPERVGNDGWKVTHDRIFRKFADYAGNSDVYRGRTDRELRVSR